MQNVVIIATSLNPESRSQKMAGKFAAYLESQGVDATLVDLRELDLPFAGPKAAWSHPDVARISGIVQEASHVVFAVPIYCYDVNAAAKNVLELIGRGFTEKIVSFICSAGGGSSYMSVMGLANHLMLDFRAVIVPRFLYASSADWDEEGNLDPEIEGRMVLLHEDMKKIHVESA